MILGGFLRKKIESYKRLLVVSESCPFPKESSYHYNYYSYPVMNYLNWNRLKNAFELLKRHELLKNNFVVLDAGCGGGVILPTLVKYYREVFAVDYSEELTRVKEWFFNNYGKNVHFKRADIRSLPFNNMQFDMIFSFDVLEHIKDVEVAINEIKRVLKHEGYLLVTLPLEEVPHKVGRLIYGLNEPDHYKGTAKNSEEILKVFLKNGFIKIEDIKTPFKFLPSKMNLYRILLLKKDS